MRGLRRPIGTILLITAGAAFLILGFGPSRSWGAWGRTIAFCFVYSAVIGSLCFWTGRAAWQRAVGWPLWRRIGWYAGSMTAAIVGGTSIAHAVLYWWGVSEAPEFWASFRGALRFSLLVSATFGVAVMVYEYYRGKLGWTEAELRRTELERERALKLAAEARLASLAARIHPHFLFNTLNTISALIHEDPMKADAQLQRLSKLLRFSLDAPETHLVPLGREMQIVGDYLEIEAVRFGGRLRYGIEVSEEAAGCGVPPLSVQTLVENSVKHHVARSRAGGEIRVTAECREGEVVVGVWDDGPGVPDGAAMAGHGLEILRGRLEALFGDRAGMRIAGSRVEFRVPVNADSRVRIG